MGVSPDSAVAGPIDTAVSEETVLVQALERCRRDLILGMLIRRVVYVAAAAALVPLLVIIGDHLWSGGLSRLALASLLVLWGAGLLGGMVGSVATAHLRPLSLIYVARYLERASGIRHNSVVNAMLLRQAGLAMHAREAVVHQAARDVAAHPPSDVLDGQRGRRAAAVLLAALVAWGVYLASAPKPVGPSLARFFGAKVAVPPATWLELIKPAPGEVVHAGQALPIEIAVHGKSVADLRFDVLDPGDETGTTVRSSAWAERAASGDDRRRLVLAPFEVRSDIYYRCTGGDARLDGVIRVQPQPDVDDVEVFLEPPAYTGWASGVAAGPDPSVLAGTRATFKVRANVPLADPVFVFQAAGESRTRMSVTPDTPEAATLSVKLTQSGTYRVEFSDQWGFPYRNATQWRIEVRPDTPPAIRIVVPAEGQTADDVVDIRQLAELAAVAEDDVAVGALAFVFQEGDTVRRPDVTLAGAERGPRLTGRIQTADLGLAVGRTAEVWFEATDGRVLPDGRAAPQTAKSRVLTLVHSAEPPASAPSPSEAVTSQPSQGSERTAGREEPKTCDGTGENGSGTETVDGQSGTGEGSGATNENPEPADTQPADGGSGGQPGEGAAEQGAGNGAGSDNPKPAEGGDKPEGGEKGDGAGNEGGFQGELKRFVEEHGKKAGEAGRAARRAGGAATQPAPGSEPPSASQPSQGESGSGECQGGEAKQPGAGAREGGQANGGGAPAEGGTPEGQSSEGSGTVPGQGGGGIGDGEPKQDTPGESKPLQSPPHQPGTGTPDAEDPSGLVETLKLLELMERGVVITEEMLIDAGWPPEQAAGFLRALERLHAAAREAGGIQNARRMLFDTRVGEEGRQVGQGMSSQVGRDLAPADARQDGLARIAPPAEQNVPEDLEPLLEAYYRAVAAQRARER